MSDRNSRSSRIFRTDEELSKLRDRRLADQPRGFSIRTKLAIATAIPVLVLLGGASVFLGKQFSDLYHGQARERAAAYLKTLAVPAARALAVHALDRIDAYLGEAGTTGNDAIALISVAALDGDGKLVAHSDTGAYLHKGGKKTVGALPTLPDEAFRDRARKLKVPAWLRHRLDDGTLVLDVSMPAVSGLRWGTLVARYDLTGVEAQIRNVISVFVVMAILLTLTVAMALRLALTRLVVDPIDELARSAESITRGHLDTRAWVVAGDEIGGLAVDFNTMADELQTYTESLERKVEERSAEVRRKNNELEKVNEQLTGANDRLKDLNEELERIATTDGLTGVFNRRHFDEALELEFKRAERRKLPFSVVLADVDHFKNYNDTNGHQAGDRALQDLAHTFLMQLRETDVLARYGGEEFIGLLLDTPKEGAIRVAETLRAGVEKHDFEFGMNQPSGRVTASIGVASFPEDAQKLADLVECADKALYLAKAAGRNRVIAWGKDAAEAEAALAKVQKPDGRKG